MQGRWATTVSRGSSFNEPTVPVKSRIQRIKSFPFRAWQRVHRAINWHVYPLNQVAMDVEKHHLHFYNRTGLNHKSHLRVRWSLIHMWLPGVTTLLFGIRALIFFMFPQWFDTPAKRLAFYSEMFPENGRRSYEMTFMIWSFMYALYIFYVIRGPLVKFALLATLRVHRGSSITPEDLQVTSVEYKEFSKFRHQARNVSDFIVYGLSTLATICFFIQGYFTGVAWKVNALHATLWEIYFMFWVFYVCSAAYDVPIFITIIARYIQVKMTTVLVGMDKLIERLRTQRMRDDIRRSRAVYHLMVRLQCRYADIQAELRNYSIVVERCINFIFLVYTGIICYITYLLFLSNTTFGFVILYSNVYLAHITVLTLLIMRCSAITRFNGRLQRQLFRFYIVSAQRRFYGPLEFLQMDQMAQNLRRKVGFSLINGFRIDTNAYFAVIYSISLFFMLVFKQKIV